MFELSAWQICCFFRYAHSKFFRKSSVSGNCSTGCPVVPPFSWTSSSDTMFEILETQICCFSRNTHSKFFPKSSVSGDHLDGRSSRALFAMGMFSWYKILNFRKIYLSVLKIFRHKIFSKIICIRRTARQLVLSCHIFHERFLLIQLSTRQICCFSRYTHTIFLRKSSVPGEPLDRVSRRATASMDMFFWYNVPIVS